MVLKRKNPSFESEEQTNAGATATEPSPGEAPWSEEDKPAAPTTALAPRASTAVAARVSPAEIEAVKRLKNAYTVQYDSLASVQATQGSFNERETNTNLGAELILELLSYQDQFVCSPNDDKAPKDLVRYSADGVTASDGTDLKAHLEFLKEVWPNARINQRYVVVGALNAAERSDKFDGSLVQIDLSPKSKSQFDRYLVQSAFDIAKGKITGEQAKVVRLTAEVATNANNQKYTLVRFATCLD